MKKNYHYLFTLDDLKGRHFLFQETDSLFPDEDKMYSDVIYYLDQQSFDVSNTVIRKLVEYAGMQIGG
ncbi:MAG: hypothetical protein R6U58_11480 [Bacteroidales bacterium]